MNDSTFFEELIMILAGRRLVDPETIDDELDAILIAEQLIGEQE